MIRIGVVDIDTSHPQAWMDILKQGEKARYAALFDSGDVWDAAYVRAFAEKNGLAICASIDELAEKTDVGFIQGANWDAHLDRAKPFLDRGKPVFLDKPIVGSLADLNRARELVKRGATILGGSSLRYAYELIEFLEQPKEKRGEILGAFVSTGLANDPFNYSIHGVEMLQGALGPGAEWVQFLGRTGGAEVFQIGYASGVLAFLQRMTPFHNFSATITTTTGVHHVKADPGRIYKALLERIVDALEGKRERMVDIDALAESIRVMLAMKKTLATGGRAYLRDLGLDDESHDGKTFAAEYRLSKIKSK